MRSYGMTKNAKNIWELGEKVNRLGFTIGTEPNLDRASAHFEEHRRGRSPEIPVRRGGGVAELGEARRPEERRTMGRRGTVAAEDLGGAGR